jgi:hypothetical protein
MRLDEIIKPPIEGYVTTNNDNSKPTFQSARKTRLTLGMIRKLTKINDLKTFEYHENLKKIRLIYSVPADDAGGGGSPF